MWKCELRFAEIAFENLASLEQNGLKFVFSSDTCPNEWFVDYVTGAGLVILAT